MERFEEIMKSKFSLFKAFLFYDSHKLKPTTMLRTGVLETVFVGDNVEKLMTDLR